MRAERISCADELSAGGAQWDELRELRLQEVRSKVAEGLRAAEAGDVHPGDEAFDEIIGSRSAPPAS